MDGTRHPTAGQLSLQEPLRAASVEYDARVFKKTGPQGKGAQPVGQPANTGANAAQGAAQAPAVLISLNPFVRLEWVEPETIYAQTAFVRFYRTEPLPTFKYTRWHALHLSPQAAMLIEH